MELNSSGTATAINTFGADGLVSRRSGGSSTFYQFDQSGSTSARLNSSGAVLDYHGTDAFGAPIVTQTTSDPYDGFGAQDGYYTDHETGLLLLGRRFYDPGLGRFVNRDPAGADGGWNFYRYCNNDPVNNSDPDGLWPIDATAWTRAHRQDIIQAVQLSQNPLHIPGFNPLIKSMTEELLDVGTLSGKNADRPGYCKYTALAKDALTLAQLLPLDGVAARGVKVLGRGLELGGKIGPARNLALGLQRCGLIKFATVMDFDHLMMFDGTAFKAKFAEYLADDATKFQGLTNGMFGDTLLFEQESSFGPEDEIDVHVRLAH